jgi:hypothetical protein
MSPRRAIGLLIAAGFLSTSQVAWAAIIPVSDDRYISFRSHNDWDPLEDYLLSETPDPAFSDFDAALPDGGTYAEQTSSIRGWQIAGEGYAEGYGPAIGMGLWGYSRLSLQFEVNSAEAYDLFGFVTNDIAGWGYDGIARVELKADEATLFSFEASSIAETINFAEQVALVPGVSYQLFASASHGFDGGGIYSVTLQVSERVPALSPSWLIGLAVLLLGGGAAALRGRLRLP